MRLVVIQFTQLTPHQRTQLYK